MHYRRKYTNMVGAAAVIALTLPIGVVQADLSEQILSEIESGVRSIRPEITSLKNIAVPEPSNLSEFIRDKDRAIELGKALFWDMQLGSDGVQACASCHFNAGADSRAINQLSPGLQKANQNGEVIGDTTFSSGTGANYHLAISDFPRHVKEDTQLFTSPVLRNSNDVVSSQGVSYTRFFDVLTGYPFDFTLVAADAEGFQVTNINTRRVEPRNTPTVINAVFNHRQFWDGRASNTFNGVNPFGDADVDARVFENQDGDLTAVKISLDNASLASQALGPPLSRFEMSSDGRRWVDIGNKVIGSKADRNRYGGIYTEGLQPLAYQMVSPTDSVLGGLANTFGPGLKKSYEDMIRAAFQPKWWNSKKFVKIDADGNRTVVRRPVGEYSYSQMEINFSLYFGIAVQLYEATLVSDDSPVDRYLDGDTNALTQAELIGFHIADDEGRCLNCHGGGEFTFASVNRVNERGMTRIRRGDLIDEGFNNIGVTPTLEDLGVGGIGAFNSPISFARKTQLGLFDNDKIPGIDDEMAADLGADGAFKIPTLRNVALTAPYFHNGGELSLSDVLEFYFRGGNFRRFDINKNHPVIGYDADRVNESEITGLGILRGELRNSGPGLDEADKANLIAFLNALTDERVVNQQAPFDHPQLFVPEGHYGDENFVFDNGYGEAITRFIEIPAVGAAGGSAQPRFVDNLR